MFTGLISDLGSVTALELGGEGATLRISTRLASELERGDSVAVNGVCLTATEVRDGEFAAEAMAETLRRSALDRLAPGAKVNLELALRAEDRLGGHVVQGHVDGTGTIGEIRAEGIARVLRIDADPGPRPLSRGEGLDRGERRQSDGQRAVRARRVRGFADPRDDRSARTWGRRPSAIGSIWRWTCWQSM